MKKAAALILLIVLALSLTESCSPIPTRPKLNDNPYRMLTKYITPPIWSYDREEN